MAAPTIEKAETVRDLPDLKATEALAAALAGVIRPGDVIALSGELGSGKTTFARALIGAMADRLHIPREEVPSPTFTLVQAYEFPGLPVWHFDLYRLKRPEDAYELGIEEAFANAACLVEWPERLGSLLPPERLDVRLDFTNHEKRRARLSGSGNWAARIGALRG